ncbi:MAG: DNA-formamidopyrimidine glycosylase, partial [Candidatus Pacebacteria bacterium]|nr:DNA-formamidopyrimidine glycosylase [Candidatus Paceibacterota bacterium]
MPELPEVETIRRQLEKAVVGKTIARVEVLEQKMFEGDPKAVAGQKIGGTGRTAKVLKIFLGNGDALLVHFKLNGQFFLEAPGQDLERRFTRVILHLDDGSKILFNDSRKFAWMRLVRCYKEEANPAIEPFRKDFTLENFSKILAETRRPVKILLMDQEKISGIGNIYANESLFASRIDPFRPANSLKPAEVKRLFEAIPAILSKAIECHGSSGKDEWYRQLNGKPGCYQEHFLVYQRDGQKCSG